MMGPMGGNGGGLNYSTSFSTSNLSASAPPFTVDRISPNSNPNPNSLYPKSPYSVERPYTRTWQYTPQPSAPLPDSVTNSIGISSGQLYDEDYQFSASATIGTSSAHWSDLSPSVKVSGTGYGCYGGGGGGREVESYYSPYVKRAVGEGSSGVEDDGRGYCVLTTSGMNLPYAKRVVGEFEDNGPCYSVLATSGMSGSSQIDYAPGLFDLEYGRQWADGLGFGDGKRGKGVEGDGSFFSEKASVGDSVSFTNQMNQGACRDEYGNKSKEDSGAQYQNFNQVSNLKFHAGSLNMRSIEDQSCLEHNIGFLSYESNKTHIPASSATYPESNPLLQSFEMQDEFSNFRNAFSPYAKCGGSVDSPFMGPPSVIRSSPSVVIRPPPANLGQGITSCTPARINISKQASDQISVSSTSVKEPSNLLYAKDAYDCNVEARFGAQLPDKNASGDFSTACDDVPFVNSTEECSDFTDYDNAAVDSPCWKAAAASQISPFDVEADNSNHAKRKLNEYYEDHQNLISKFNSTSLISEKGDELSKYDEKEPAKDGVVFSLERPLCDIFPSREINDRPSIPSKESRLLNNLKSDFVGEDGPQMTLSDVPEGGDVAVHVAERVLDSPSPQEDATELTKLLDPQLKVPTMIKTMQNLSELLLFHLADDACSLDNESTETLKHIISNLDSCLTKKVTQGTTAGIPFTAHEAENSIRTGYQCVHGGKINYKFSGEKDEKSASFSTLRDELDKTTDDVTAEAIKKVLEDNFHFDAGMHSQALLFKSLWLEAEAKLCSISFKARFDRVKNQMEKTKLKATRENEAMAEMTSKAGISLNPTPAPQLSPKACDVTIPKSTIQNLTISSSSESGSEVEASVMARFNILRSREENLKKPINTEREKQTEKFDGEHAGPITTTFNILKVQQEMSKLMNTVEEKQPGIVDGEHADPFLARFNILKSRDDNSKSVHMEDEQRPEMVDGIFYKGSCSMDEFEEEKILNVALKPRFMHQNEGKFGSYVDGFGYELLNPSITSNPMDGMFNMNSISSSSRIINQDNSGWRDTSSSDWEHVRKDDFSWKN